MPAGLNLEVLSGFIVPFTGVDVVLVIIGGGGGDVVESLPIRPRTTSRVTLVVAEGTGAAAVPQRPNTHPPTLRPKPWLLVCAAAGWRWSAAIPLSRLRFRSEFLWVSVGRAACAVVALTTGCEENDRLGCPVSI